MEFALSKEIIILTITAASIAFFHTMLGPDHYLPFILMSRANRWSIYKTTWVTTMCGVGHVLSSVLLGLIGILLGIAVSKLEVIESFRGGIAAWVLIALGLVYFVWGLRKGLRSKQHDHWHSHSSEDIHRHSHTHNLDHLHVHNHNRSKNLTPWVLFAIFIFGPCEPLIPLLMYPAAQRSLFGVISIAIVFGVVTILTMLGIVLVSSTGIRFISFERMERYIHAFAGATICVCGVAIQFFGL